MPLVLDSEVAAGLAAEMATRPAQTTVAARGDCRTLRHQTDIAFRAADDAEPDSPQVSKEDHQVRVADGSTICARWYTKTNSNPGSAVVYLHGGGMVAGSVELYDRHVARYVQQAGVPFLSVDYRLAPEFPGTTPVQDSHSALAWLVERADELGVDPLRIAVMGDSGGGGVAAGVAIAAREAGTPLAKQILIYPMLDDRNLEPDPHIAPLATWNYDQNYTGWYALLGDNLGTSSVPPLAAPARLTDFSRLAPAFIDVGELDIFRDEGLRYSLELTRAGVSCELHVRPGLRPRVRSRRAERARLTTVVGRPLSSDRVSLGDVVGLVLVPYWFRVVYC